MTELMITFKKSKTILRREFSFFVAVLYWWKERMCWLTFTKPIKIPRSLQHELIKKLHLYSFFAVSFYLLWILLTFESSGSYLAPSISSLQELLCEKSETLTQMFSSDFCEIFNNTCFYRILLVAASVHYIMTYRSHCLQEPQNIHSKFQFNSHYCFKFMKLLK